jgi:beta-glucosidase
VGDVVPRLRRRRQGAGPSRLGAAVRASHHALLAHGVVVREFREAGRPGRIGITLNLTVADPAGESDEDLAAARRLDGYQNRWFLDPLFRGEYPSDIVELYERQVGPFDALHEGDLETIAQPIDFLGVNFYRPNRVAAAVDGVLGVREVERGGERTSMGWVIVPEALTELLLRVARDYGDIPPADHRERRRLRRPGRRR